MVKANAVMWTLGFAGFAMVAAGYFGVLLFNSLASLWLCCLGLIPLCAALPTHYMMTRNLPSEKP